MSGPVRSEEIWRLHLCFWWKNTGAKWCDWCFTAEKSVPVRSDEECTFHKGIPSIYRDQNYVDWSFPWFAFVVLDVSMVTVAGRLQKVHSKRHG